MASRTDLSPALSDDDIRLRLEIEDLLEAGKLQTRKPLGWFVELEDEVGVEIEFEMED